MRLMRKILNFFYVNEDDNTYSNTNKPINTIQKNSYDCINTGSYDYATDSLNSVKAESETYIEFENGYFSCCNGKTIIKNSYVPTYILKDAYESLIYYIDGKRYDLRNINNIKKIPVIYQSKDSNDTVSSPIFDIEYILKMSAKHLFSLKLYDNCFQIFLKAIEISFNKDDDYSVNQSINELIKLMLEAGYINEAEKQEEILNEKYRQTTDPVAVKLKTFKKILKDAKQLETDLLLMDAHSGCCSECSKYQGRVYSISGKDKRFPKLPDAVHIYGGIHPNCRHLFYPYFLGDPNQYDPKATTKHKIIRRSNRPFIDERSEDDIKAYEEYQKEINNEKQKKLDRKEYYKIFYAYPDQAPKSFGAYRRMKNANTKNYQKLIAFLKANNFEF